MLDHRIVNHFAVLVTKAIVGSQILGATFATVTKVADIPRQVAAVVIFMKHVRLYSKQRHKVFIFSFIQISNCLKTHLQLLFLPNTYFIIEFLLSIY